MSIDQEVEQAINDTFDAIQESLRAGEFLAVENLLHRLIFATPNGRDDALATMRAWVNSE